MFITCLPGDLRRKVHKMSMRSSVQTFIRNDLLNGWWIFHFTIYYILQRGWEIEVMQYYEHCPSNSGCSSCWLWNPLTAFRKAWGVVSNLKLGHTLWRKPQCSKVAVPWGFVCCFWSVTSIKVTINGSSVCIWALEKACIKVGHAVVMGCEVCFIYSVS